MSEKIIIESIKKHSDVLESLDKDNIRRAAEAIIKSFNNGKKIFWCGNGGSASQANHLSGELVGGMYQKKIKPFQSICLNVDTAFITAWSNDDSFDNIFVRQLEALGNNDDMLVALSTSGNSKNIINAIKYAHSQDIRFISLTGNDGGEAKRLGGININVKSNDTQRIQEMHILIGHIICDLVEKSL
tara:strand:+ start:22 stop:582 length:561 start_codon:yes stop_codon:yes gene_type:complete